MSEGTQGKEATIPLPHQAQKRPFKGEKKTFDTFPLKDQSTPLKTAIPLEEQATTEEITTELRNLLPPSLNDLDKQVILTKAIQAKLLPDTMREVLLVLSESITAKKIRTGAVAYLHGIIRRAQSGDPILSDATRATQERIQAEERYRQGQEVAKAKETVERRSIEAGEAKAAEARAYINALAWEEVETLQDDFLASLREQHKNHIILQLHKTKGFNDNVVMRMFISYVSQQMASTIEEKRQLLG